MKELDKIEFVILTMSIIITYHNNMTYTNIAYMIGQNIIAATIYCRKKQVLGIFW